MSTQPPANNVAIRPCAEADIRAITGIYAHHVLHGLASFEVEPPSENDLRQRYFDIVGGGFPYLVAERAGEIVGYALRRPTVHGRLIAIPRKTRFICTRHGRVVASVDG
jgi:hypothetical protein